MTELKFKKGDKVLFKGIVISDDGEDVVFQPTCEEQELIKAPVIPQYVADWIEEAKKQNYNLQEAFYYKTFGVFGWLSADKQNANDFALAWIFGYEISKKKRYTVQIPDPNEQGKITHLYKRDGKVYISYTDYPKWARERNCQLTEAEIKQDFKWAWDEGFATEVH